VLPTTFKHYIRSTAFCGLCVAVYGIALQCSAVCCSRSSITSAPLLCVVCVVRCVLQCAAVYCIALQCSAVCCSLSSITSAPLLSVDYVLQCVAVCCSVLQCVAHYMLQCVNRR